MKIFDDMDKPEKRRLTFGFLAGIWIGLAIACVTALVIA